MTKLSAVGTVCLVGTVVAACGARTGLPVDNTTTETPEAGACTPHDVALLRPVPNLYFVLDHSGSMKEMNKWTNVRSVIADLTRTLGPRARFGAAAFPNPLSPDACGPGAEVMSLRPGDTNGTVAAELLQATNVAPNGGTPTAATFRLLKPTLTSFKGATFAILATDGGPNCNALLSCGINQCTANLDAVVSECQPNTPPNCCDPNSGTGGGPEDCLDTKNSISAVSELVAAGVETFVIGIPGSAPYEQLLDQLAQAGGAARPSSPYYYRVDTADTQALSDVLTQIANRITSSCTMTLATTPTDPNEVNVVVNGAPVPRDTPDGWTLTGTTLTLLGATCQGLLDGKGQDLHVTLGCPTITH